MPIASPNYTQSRIDELRKACEEQLASFNMQVRTSPDREIPTSPFLQLTLTRFEPNYDAVSVFHMRWTFEVMAVVMGQTEDDAEQKIHSVADALVKMFSDNALGDRSTDHTGRYHANGAHWYKSAMSAIEFFAIQESDYLTRVLRFTLEIEARVQP